MTVSAYDLAARFVGLTEGKGPIANPQVLAMLRLEDDTAQDDATPWCSAFVNYVAWLLRLPRSKSLAARSWLAVGKIITLEEAKVGYDIVVLNRGMPPQPPATVLDAPGHVGFFGGWSAGAQGQNAVVALLGGNQGDAVSIAWFPESRILGVRRLYEES